MPSLAKRRSSLVTSTKQVLANRKNAKASSGPRSSGGKRRSSRNALRHGLAVDLESDPEWRDIIDALTKILLLERHGRHPEYCREAARSVTELQRIRKVRSRVVSKL